MEKKTKTVGVRMSESQYNQLKLIADAKKRKPSDLLRILFENYVEIGN